MVQTECQVCVCAAVAAAPGVCVCILWIYFKCERKLEDTFSLISRENIRFFGTDS